VLAECEEERECEYLILPSFLCLLNLLITSTAREFDKDIWQKL